LREALVIPAFYINAFRELRQKENGDTLILFPFIERRAKIVPEIRFPWHLKLYQIQPVKILNDDYHIFLNNKRIQRIIPKKE
jgi:hypothetical protein